MTHPRPPECLAGDDALLRGAWTEAREAFEAALRVQESPEALEGVGLAAWWLDLADLVFEVRERAYRLYLERDDKHGAAHVAVWLAWDCWAFRGLVARCGGRAGRPPWTPDLMAHAGHFLAFPKMTRSCDAALPGPPLL